MAVTLFADCLTIILIHLKCMLQELLLLSFAAGSPLPIVNAQQIFHKWMKKSMAQYYPILRSIKALVTLSCKCPCRGKFLSQ